jgi:hypothetical protein
VRSILILVFKDVKLPLATVASQLGPHYRFHYSFVIHLLVLGTALIAQNFIRDIYFNLCNVKKSESERTHRIEIRVQH